MSARDRSLTPRRGRRIRNRRLVAALLMIATLATVATFGAELIKSPASSNSVSVMLGDKRLANLKLDVYVSDGVLNKDALKQKITQVLPAKIVESLGRSRVTYRVNREATSRQVAALGVDGGSVGAVATPVSSRIAAPVVRQRFRNNCETASLSSLMAGLGRPVRQAQLQDELARSGPADPIEGPDGRVWGDPDEGFVGRFDGGGAAGGFGVYPQPISQLARRNGVRLDDLSGAPVEKIYDRVLGGLPVLVWIGLSDGPYEEWRSQKGRLIRVNWGEHAVVLTGVSEADELRVMNPLNGTIERWDRATFETKWALLGRRALAARRR